jgi:hypothetical protein
MCQFLSAVVTRQGKVLTEQTSDSHEDIIALHGIKDGTTQNIVRVEYSSVTLSDLDSYKLGVDENITPDWFGEYREQVESELREMVRGRIIEGDVPILTAGKWILKSGTVGKCMDGCVIIWAEKSATIEHAGYATIQDAGHATIQNAGYATIQDAGHATIQNAGLATIQNAGCATIQYAGHATIQYAGYATIQNAGCATIQYAGHATIQDAGCATIINSQNAKITK